MPQGFRAATVLCALAAAAPAPAWAQTGGGGGGGGSGAAGGSAGVGGSLGAGTGTPGASGLYDPSSGLLRPGTIRPPPMPETHRRDAPAPAPSWSPQPAPGAKPPSTGGIMSEQQARDRIAAAGYRDVRTLRPTYSGSWTGQATMRGSPVRVTIDPRGTISADHSDRYR